MRGILLVIILAGGLLPRPACADDRNGDGPAGLELFNRVFETIHRAYLRKVTREALARAAIDGMLASLDPHSAYLTESEFEARETALAGHAAGIGVDLQEHDGAVIVVAPVAGSPAAQAGLQPGDRILRIDDRPVAPLLLDDVAARLKGAPGTTVRLVVATGGHAPRALRLVRADVHVPVVRSALFGHNAYIRLSAFDAEAAASIANAWTVLARTGAGGPIRGLVLDLRDNGGGEVEAAVAVADLFVRHGTIVTVRGRDLAAATRYQARRQDITDGAPIVVLTNARTASASEIVAGALQDHRRAAIVGTRTFGKGSVQTTLPLDGDGALVLTTALYFTPSGRSIQARGIMPDVVVHEPGDVPDAAIATEASLPHAIEPPDATERPPSSLTGLPHVDVSTRGTDPQLQQGLRLLDMMAAASR